jgi:uncharacterized membrane-anchored protein
MSWKTMLNLLGCVLVLAVGPTAHGADDPAETGEETMESFLKQFTWVQGPGQAKMEGTAQIDVPPGYMFTGAEGTQRLLQAMGNLIGESEVGFLSPTNLDWFVVFTFTKDGFVKDDDKDSLDSAAMLKVIRKGNENANSEKRKIGFPEMTLIGWEVEPRYNDATKNLEWALRFEADGEQVVNFNTRVLGRRGVMEVQLVVEPEALTATLPAYRELMTTYNYQPGETYAEYQPGDKLAKYGLAALVTGAGVAVAAKTGLLAGIVLFLKKGWKLVVGIVVAVGVFLKRLVVGRTEPNIKLD